MNNSRYAPRDPAVEAALADLGGDRRDFITSYDDPRSGLTAREERAQRLQAKHEADDRRASREAAAARGDQRAEQLDAWHNATNILADPAAPASEDIAGGQSHRARLAAMRANGQFRDYDDAPGPSRRLQHQSNRDISSGDYVAVHGAVAGSSDTQRTFSSSTPRGLQSAPIPTNSSRGHTAPPPRPDGHVRPLSPRSQGTVRFGASGRRTERPSSAVNNDQPQHAPARSVLQIPSTAPRTIASSSTFPRTVPGASSSVARPTATAASSSAPRPSVTTARPSQRPTTATAPTASTRSAVTTTQTTATTALRPNPDPGAPALFTAYHTEDGIKRQMMQGQALWHATRQDTEEAERFVRSHPEAPAYLQEARRRLINEVTGLAMRMDQQEIDRYINAHKERKWMVLVALKAAELLKYASDDEVRRHYAENEGHRDFFRAAMVVHGTQRSVASGASASASATVTPTASPSLSSASTVVAPLSSLATARPPTNGSNTSRLAQAATAVPQTHPLATGNTTTPVPAVNNNQPPRAASNITTSAPTSTTQNRLQAPVTNGSTQQANGSVSTSSSRSSLRSAATDVTIPTPRQGNMNVAFFDTNGTFLGHEQITVNAPINATLSLNSTAADFDPRSFFASFRALLERDSTDRGRRTEAAPQAAPIADDGIWGSDEEL